MWNPESIGMESGIHSVQSGIQDSLGLPYMGRQGPFNESWIGGPSLNQRGKKIAHRAWTKRDEGSHCIKRMY